MLADRDIVVKAVAQGGDPADCTAGVLAQGKPAMIGAADDAAILHTVGWQYAHRARGSRNARR